MSKQRCADCYFLQRGILDGAQKEHLSSLPKNNNYRIYMKKNILNTTLRKGWYFTCAEGVWDQPNVREDINKIISSKRQCSLFEHYKKHKVGRCFNDGIKKIRNENKIIKA